MTASSEQTNEQASQAPESGASAQSGPQPEGRRTQLRIMRENLQSLSRDVESFGKSQGANSKRLESQIASLRKSFSAQTRSKDFANYAKSHEAGSKRLEKQVATLRNELAALKISIAKDVARSRAKQEATLSRILAKVSAKPKPAKPAKRPKKK
jgi:hypothetical protein